MIWTRGRRVTSSASTVPSYLLCRCCKVAASILPTLATDGAALVQLGDGLAEDREQKIFANLEKAKTEHEGKLNQSNTHFKNTRVTSCSGVLMKNGKKHSETIWKR